MPFPTHSVNLFTGPTSVGKTTYIVQLINNHHLFFEKPIKRILVVLCNERIEELPVNPIHPVPIEYVPFDQYNFDLCQEGDLVVIDDIADIAHPLIQHTISVGAHHYKLASLFLVTHSLLKTGKYHVLDKLHRIFLFLRSNSSIRLFDHILRNFYHDGETKEALRSVVQFLVYSKQREVLALELNSIASSSNPPLLGFSHLPELINKGFCIVYTLPMTSQEYARDFDGQIADPQALKDFPFGSMEEMPRHALVAVPAHIVIEAKDREADSNSPDAVKEKAKWANVNKEMVEMIRSHFALRRWRHIENLAKAILANKNYCITESGSVFYLRGKPNTQVSFVDFASVVTRRPGPREKLDTKDPQAQLFSLHVLHLLRGRAPRDIFVNKLFLPKKF